MRRFEQYSGVRGPSQDGSPRPRHRRYSRSAELMRRGLTTALALAACALACILTASAALAANIPTYTIAEAKLLPDGSGPFILADVVGTGCPCRSAI